jgi:hypothetical protein
VIQATSAAVRKKAMGSMTPILFMPEMSVSMLLALSWLDRLITLALPSAFLIFAAKALELIRK